MQNEMKYDVIVAGGGHAGIEAALSCARTGLKTCLITINIDHIGQLSCNPSIGGLAKGQLVREIDALGGEMGKAADATCIQFKVLNSNKGPAVRGLRAQADKITYPIYMREILQNTPNLHIRQAMITEITTDEKSVNGIITDTGAMYSCGALIVTTGTFLSGKIYIGLQSFSGGRLGDPSPDALPASIRKLGISTGRMKTGTNPRVDRRSLDFTKFTEQPGDPVPEPFSFSTASINTDQAMCWLVNTTEETSKVIMNNLDRSPLYSSDKRMIFGIGPRYCPSIEDKIVKFPDKKTHQVFIEPEARHSFEMYLNGLSTSLPLDVQYMYLRTIPGFENVVITRPGYGIEYDYVPPTQINSTLESRTVPGLYFAGQINGTSGYEEAAGQGLLAGLNASLKIRGMEPFLPRRDEAYLGVMADDLVTLGVEEPYRLFSSRAEHRLVLRNDNADIRLSEYGFKAGLISRENFDNVRKKFDFLQSEKKRLSSIHIHPGSESAEKLETLGLKPLHTETDLLKLLKRPEVPYVSLSVFTKLPAVPDHFKQYFEAEVKYEGYIKKQYEDIERLKKLESEEIPPGFNYLVITGLPQEARQRLTDAAPLTLGQASRLRGVTPADISVLLIYLKKYRETK